MDLESLESSNDVWVVEIQKVRFSAWGFDPEKCKQSKEENWFLRSTVRSFKVAAKTQDEAALRADEMLEAYLSVNGGTGTWNMYKFFPGRK